MAQPACIVVEDLCVGYDQRVVLKNLNFAIAAGEIVTILGGSGCGKSTLLKHIMGLYQPMSGRILIQGQDFTAAEGAARRDIMRHFGVMYQSGALFGSMSVLENVCLPLEYWTDLPQAAMEHIARIKLAWVGLSEAAHAMPAELSGGMIKRAAIARALALEPAIVFLDEPSAGLDPVMMVELDQLILDLRDRLGLTFVLVTHELASIHRVADRAIMLDRDSQGIVAMGTPQALAQSSSERVRRFFNPELTSHRKAR